MFDLFRLWCGTIVRTFRCRRGLMLENLALRQQLAVLKRKHPRPKLGPLDKLFWVVALRCWSRWKETVPRQNSTRAATFRISNLPNATNPVAPNWLEDGEGVTMLHADPISRRIEFLARDNLRSLWIA